MPPPPREPPPLLREAPREPAELRDVLPRWLAARSLRALLEPVSELLVFPVDAFGFDEPEGRVVGVDGRVDELGRDGCVPGRAAPVPAAGRVPARS
jgi:hypothetical protein